MEYNVQKYNNIRTESSETTNCEPFKDLIVKSLISEIFSVEKTV